MYAMTSIWHDICNVVGLVNTLQPSPRYMFLCGGMTWLVMRQSYIAKLNILHICMDAIWPWTIVLLFALEKLRLERYYV